MASITLRPSHDDWRACFGGESAKLGDVGAGHECLLAGAGQHDRAHRGVVRELAGDAQQFLVGRPVQGVQHLGTGDRDDGDGAVALDLDCHEWTLLAHGWSRIRPDATLPHGSGVKRVCRRGVWENRGRAGDT